MLTALPARQRKILATPGAIVILHVRDPEWVEHFHLLLRDTLLAGTASTTNGWFDPSATAFVLGRAQQWEDYEELEDALGLAEAAGQTVVGISHDPARCLPPQLVAVAHHITVPALAESGIRKVLRAVTGQPVRARISGDLGGRLTPAVIAAACRKSASARECLATMMRLAGAAPARFCDDGHLEPELFERGPAAGWARQAVTRVLGWREYPSAKPKSEIGLLAGTPEETRLLVVAMAGSMRATLVSVLPGEVAGLMAVTRVVRARSARVTRGTKPLLVFIGEADLWSTAHVPGRAILSGLLEAAAAGAATVVVGATDAPGGIDDTMLARWGAVKHMRSRPGVLPPRHPGRKNAH